MRTRRSRGEMGGAVASKRYGRQDVIAAALEILDERGLEAVALREVARRLDAHLNTVSFQVKTKARLLELMADTIMAGLTLDDLPEDPAERVEEILHRYRRALLTRRDGARLVAGTSVVEQNTLRVGEAIVAALLDSGATRVSAVRAFWGLHYFLIGLVQEEQATTAEHRDRFASEVTAAHYPVLVGVEDVLLTDSFDDRFAFGLDALISHARSTR
ncbi:TetR/AcrR family transcriptional regulator C-terminal domain-containing protein [Microbacterium allomyrinae]|nr:TetR/AcrR family transcriptional regulator C-terminal domain-containing protein [Microbacterium allomyrinae]